LVPDHAVVKVDVRAYSSAEFDRIKAAGAALAAHPGIDGVTIRSSFVLAFPPWPHIASTDAIIARTNRLYAELGRTPTPTQMGSSADVSIAAETGVPAIDGFGMEGGGAHSVDDDADFASFTPRVYLLARLLMDVGHDPML
jgi:glutamate carboxypeptidase